MKRRLAQWLRAWAARLDPNWRPAPTVVGHATRNIQLGELVEEGDIVSSAAIVVRQPLSEIRVVHSSLGTQVNRSRQRKEENAWKNRR